jgi:hypothetical protein
MIVLNFIVGLGMVVLPIILIFQLGKFIMKKSGDYDEYTEFAEILNTGFVFLAIAFLIVSLPFALYILGKWAMNELF